MMESAKPTIHWRPAMSRMFAIASIFFALLTPSQSPQDAQQLIKQVAQTYQSLKSYRVEGTSSTQMTKENSAAAFEQKQSESFALSVVKPDRIRGELRSPLYSFVTISDGRTEWTYVPDLKQYTRKPKMDEKAMMALLSGGGMEAMLASVMSDPLMFVAKGLPTRVSEFEQIAKGIKTAKVIREDSLEVGAKQIRCDVVEVEYVPTRGAEATEYSTRTLWIDRTRNAVLRSIARSRSQQQFGGSSTTTATVNFTVAELNVPLADSLFTFVPPPGVNEVEKLGPVPKPSPLVGTELADFSLKDTEGRDFTLSGLRGRVVLLDFWATWCPPCLAELPYIEKLHREFKDQGLVVLGVNNEEAAVARDFMKTKAYTFTTLVDVDRQVADRYEVEAIPQVIVIGKDGKVASHHVGLKSEKELRDTLAKVGLRSDLKPGGREPSIVAVPTVGDTKISGAITLMMPAAADVNLANVVQNSSSDRVVKQIQPSFPPVALAARANGPVHVLVQVSEEGSVREANVVSGHPLLREAALMAAKQWTFKPLSVNGVSVKSIAVLTFNFPSVTPPK